MTDNILDFLRKNRFMTIACPDESGAPYCFICFYLFDEAAGMLLFASSPQGTRHVPLLFHTEKAAGSILPDSMPPIFIQGIQFTGKVIRPDDVSSHSRQNYTDRYPEATSMPHNIWGIEPDFIKLTDNSLGFGYKEVWRR